MTAENETPFSIRVAGRPPSLQVRKLPQGGAQKGAERIREKLHEAAPDLREEHGFLVESPLATSLIIANEDDLTRECVIVTLEDDTLLEILNRGLLSPSKIADLLASMKKNHPHAFVIFQRYLFGIERADGLKVPFGVVEASAVGTLNYLAKLPESLHKV